MDADRVWIDEETDVRIERQSVPGGVGVDDVDGGVLVLESKLDDSVVSIENAIDGTREDWEVQLSEVDEVERVEGRR